MKLLENILSASDEESFKNSEEEITQKEKDLNIKFPAILRNYYKNYGKCGYITQNCNNQYEPLLLQELFIPNEEFFTKDKEYLVFYQCEESVIYCGIKLSDLEQDNPPVYLCVWDNPNWYLDNESLSNFLASKALAQMAVEGRLTYWVYFRENSWNISDYQRLWQLNDEIIETTQTSAWRIFIKEDVLVVAESAMDENKDYILAVNLASFHRESIERMLLSAVQNDGLSDYVTNLY